MTDVTIRLRAGTFRINGKPWMDLHNEAADRIEELQAEVARLLAALEFYADREFDGYDVRVTDYGLSMDTGHIIKDGGDVAIAALEYKD